MQIIELRRLDREGRAVEKVPGIQINKAGIIIPENTDFDQWKELGHWLSSVMRHVKWYHDDWYGFGVRKFTKEVVEETHNQLEFSFCVKPELSMQLSAVPIQKRLPGLTYEHYVELVKLPTAREQDYWAKQAQVNKFTPNDLKKSIASGQPTRASDERNSGMWTPVGWDSELKIQQRKFPQGWEQDREFLAQLAQQIPTAKKLVELIQAAGE